MLPFIISACQNPAGPVKLPSQRQTYGEGLNREKEPARDRDRDRDRDREESIDDRERRIVNDKIIDLEDEIRAYKQGQK